MPVHVVTGKLGTGKGKYCVWKMQEALRAGKRVATNFDLKLEHLLPADSKMVACRVPDKPTAEDLDAVGHGNPDDSYNEEKNGVLVLDELGSWLNARSFGGPERAALIDWLIHARKKGWDVYLIVQNLEMIDKQVRTGLAEYVIKCMRADRIKLPVVGALLGKAGRLPKFHIANTSMADVPGLVIDRDWFKGSDLHAGYDTLQIFRTWNRNPADEKFKEETYLGPYSYLSAWHVKGRHEVKQEKQSVWGRLIAKAFKPKALAKPDPKPMLPAVACMSKLSKDDAFKLARRYAKGLDVCGG